MIATISQWALLGLAGLLVLLVSLRVYAAAPTALNGQPTPPQYLVRPPVYSASRFVFAVLCLLVFSLILIFHEDIRKLDAALPGEVSALFQNLGDIDQNFSVTVVVSAWIFVILANITHQYNPIIILRDLIYSRMAIPQKAERIASLARSIENIPVDVAQQIVESDATNGVRVGDFDLSTDTVEFKWALCSYYRHYLGQQTGPEVTIFGEPSFAWDEIKREYLRLSASYQSLRSNEQELTNEQRTEIIGEVENLLKKLARLIACFLFVSSNTEEKFWREVGKLGISVDTTRIFFHFGSNIGKLVAAIVLAIVGGTIVFGVTFDAIFSSGTDLFHVADNTPFLWLVFGIIMYVPPVAIVVAWRHFSQTENWKRPEDEFGTFALYFIAGFCICALTLYFATPVLIELLKPSAQDTSGTTGPRLLAAIRWSFAPGILCAYAALRLQGGYICAFGETDERFARLKRGLLVGSAIGLIVFLMSLTGGEKITFPDGEESRGKFLFLATGVAFLIGGLSAAALDRGRQQRLIGPYLLTFDQLTKSLIGKWSLRETYAHGIAKGIVVVSESSDGLTGKISRKFRDNQTNRSFDVANDVKIEILDGGTVKFHTTRTEVGDGGPDDFDPDTWIGQLKSMDQIAGRLFDAERIEGKFTMEKTAD